MRKALIVLVSFAAVAGCASMGGFGGSGSGTASGSASGSAQLSSQCANPDYGVSSAARKVSTFLGATARFAGSAAELQGSLTSACAAMGRELGMGSLSGDPRSVCNAVSQRIREESQALRAQANLTIQVAAQPPRCEI